MPKMALAAAIRITSFQTAVTYLQLHDLEFHQGTYEF